MANWEGEKAKVVVGLGNPGRQYATTRHNVGFRVADVLADRWLAGPPRDAFGGQFYSTRVAAPRREAPEAPARAVMLLKPQTYMNRSGQAVRELTDFYKVSCEDVMVVLDDMALLPGRLRIRESGSAGGHKGLSDVLAAMGTETVPRLRIGIGQSPEFMEATSFVLSPFRPDEAETIARAVDRAAEAVEDWLFKGMRDVMDKYNPAT